MNHTKDFPGCPVITLPEPSAEELLLAAAEAGSWEEVLSLLEGAGRPVSRDAAERCLGLALQSAGDGAFDRLLTALPRGEYTGEVCLRSMTAEHDVAAEGSLLMLAAAGGQLGKVRILLAHGWDVNGASPDIARRLHKRFEKLDPRFRASTIRCDPRSVRNESQLRMMPRFPHGFDPRIVLFQIPGATPLAAALLCAQRDCAEELLAHGAWKEETPSVARVLMLPDREDEAFRSCRELVLTWGGARRPMALWAVIRSISEAQLEAELRRCPYSDEAIAEAAWELSTTLRMAPNRGPWAEERMRDFRRAQILARHYPHVMRRKELVGALLRQMFLLNYTEEWGDFLLTLCGEEVDLSLIREGLLHTPARKAKAFLLRLCEGRRCFMDRDSVPTATPISVLQTLVANVEFLPAASDLSVSALSCAILRSGNLPLIRRALAEGIIPAEEPTALLLGCLGEDPCASTARMLLLSVPRPHRTEGTIRFEPCKRLPYGPMFRWMPPAIREAGYDPLLEEDCPEALARELVLRGLYDYRGKPEIDTGEGRWEADMPLQVLCWLGRRDAVERWVRCGPRDLLRTPCLVRPPWEEHRLLATPLCAAAFAGQREVVETLLRLGAPADEENHGYPSMLLCAGEQETLPLTPLLAALIRGHREIARILMDHGARFDPEQDTVRRLWSLYNEKDLRRSLAQAGSER